MSDTPLPNPNTSMQPTPGANPHPPEAETTGLQHEQLFAYRTLHAVIVRLAPTLAEDDFVALETTMGLLEAGGTQPVIQQGADEFEAVLWRLTPTLGADDLAALNTVLTSLRFINNRMRANATLPAIAEEDKLPPVSPPADLEAMTEPDEPAPQQF
jgi:hypothetical protein